MAQLVKNPPAMQKTQVQYLGWEDPLEKGKATHPSIPAWRILWTVQSTESQRVGHDWLTFISLYKIIIYNIEFVYQNSAMDIRISLCMHASSVMSDSLWTHEL